MIARRIRHLLLVALAVVGLTGCGGGDGVANGTQVLVVKMSNMGFQPSSLSVHVGDTVTFHFVNDDTIAHEAVIGDAAYQQRHADMMAAMGGSSTTSGGTATTGATTTTMAPMHGMSRPAVAHPGMSDPNAVAVPAGGTGDVLFTFGKVTQLIIGCHEPGHYEAGMKAVIDVRA